MTARKATLDPQIQSMTIQSKKSHVEFQNTAKVKKPTSKKSMSVASKSQKSKSPSEASRSKKSKRSFKSNAFRSLSPSSINNNFNVPLFSQVSGKGNNHHAGPGGAGGCFTPLWLE